MFYTFFTYWKIRQHSFFQINFVVSGRLGQSKVRSYCSLLQLIYFCIDKLFNQWFFVRNKILAPRQSKLVQSMCKGKKLIPRQRPQWEANLFWICVAGIKRILSSAHVPAVWENEFFQLCRKEYILNTGFSVLHIMKLHSAGCSKYTDITNEFFMIPSWFAVWGQYSPVMI